MTDSKSAARGVYWLFEPAGSREIFTAERLSEEQRMFGQTAADFARKEVFPRAEELEAKKGEVGVPLMRQAGELGLLAVDVPEAYDGLGLDKVTTTVVVDRMAEFGTGSFSVIHSAHTGIGTLPIVFFGTEDQKQRYLPGLGSGELMGCYCLTESGSGSDALAAKTKAILSDDGSHYIVNGEKTYITNAGFADTAIVFAKVDGVDFTGFIVETGWPGVSTGNEEKKMGIHGSSTRSLILEDVKVPKENLLYQQGKGHVIAFNILNLGRYKLGASTLGGVKAALRESAVYANERKQFQTSIGTFRALREKMANMFVRAYVLEAMVYRTAGMMDEATAAVDHGAAGAAEQLVAAIEQYAIEASIIKVWGTEALDYAVDEAVQIHGGYGYIEEYPVERGYRDSRIYRIFEGTNEINRLLIPGTMLKRNMKGQLPLMPAFAELEKKLASEAELVPRGDGELAAERQAVELAKLATVWASGTVTRKYLKQLAQPEYQMVVMALSDLVMEAYALDSVLSRTTQYLDGPGSGKGAIPLALTRLFVAEAVDRMRSTTARLMANCFAGDELTQALVQVERLLPFIPLATHGLKDEVAAHLLEREAYNLE
jgi:alkylation response protein AidB-like acyl-CoA dehydrogenase